MSLTTLVTFDSISSSLRLQAEYRERGFPCTLIPVPAKLGSSCGYAAEIETENPSELTELLRKLNLEWDGVYQADGNNYKMIYKNDAD
jgi:hypothetical protein